MTVSDFLTACVPGTTFADLLWDCTDPDNGTCAWETAEQAAFWHSLLPEFRSDYGHMEGERIDSGELLVWLGY